MKILLSSFETSGQRAAILFYVSSRLTLGNVMLGMAALGSLLLLIGSLPVRKQPWTRERRITGMAGLLGLLSVAGSIYWHTYDLYTHSYWGLVRPDSVIYAFYLARLILGGATIAMFAFVMFPKGAKVLLSISVALFLVSEALGVTHNGHWGLATPVISFANAWSVGMAIPAAIIFLLDRKKHELSSP